jgi:hypothetical protein
MKHLRKNQPTILCPEQGCGRSISVNRFFSEKNFQSSIVACEYCNNTFDLWDYSVDLLNKRTALLRNRAAALIGACELSFTFQLPPEDTVEIDLVELGMPVNSVLLYVNVTPIGGAGWPMQIQRNELMQNRTTSKLMFYGRRFPHDDGTAKDHDVCMSATYIPKSKDSEYFDHLALAFEYFLINDFEKMVLPCAVTIEQLVKRTVADALKKFGLSTNVGKSKWIDLEILIPLICKLLKVSPLDEKILLEIRRLWGERNSMAHKGRLNSVIDSPTAARLLTASIFCSQFLIFLRFAIDKHTESHKTI